MFGWAQFTEIRQRSDWQGQRINQWAETVHFQTPGSNVLANAQWAEQREIGEHKLKSVRINLVGTVCRDPCTNLSSGEQGEAPLPVSWLTHLCYVMLNFVHVSSSRYWTRLPWVPSALDSPQQNWSTYSWLVVALELMGTCTHLCSLFFSPVTSYSPTAQQCWYTPHQWHPVSYLRGEICPCFLSLNLLVWLNFVLLEKYPSSSNFSCTQSRKDDVFYFGNDKYVSWWGLS